MEYIVNAFSGQMIETGIVKFEISSVEEFAQAARRGAHSVVGHVDTANILSGMIGENIPFNRERVKLNPGDICYLVQVDNNRLPEGATTVPEGTVFTLKKVTVIE